MMLSSTLTHELETIGFLVFENFPVSTWSPMKHTESNWMFCSSGVINRIDQSQLSESA